MSNNAAMLQSTDFKPAFKLFTSCMFYIAAIEPHNVTEHYSTKAAHSITSLQGSGRHPFVLLRPFIGLPANRWMTPPAK